MKRDAAGKFAKQWVSEAKQRISISLTKTAWKHLGEKAKQQGISRSEVIERFARMENDNTASPDVFAADSSTFAQLQRQLLEQQQLITTLQRREQELQALIENAPDAIARFDSQARYLYVNREVENVLGLSRDVLLGKALSDIIPNEICLFWEEHLHQVFATAQEQQIEFELPTSVGTRFYQARLVPEFGFNESVTSVIVVSRDITETKQAEQERAQLILEQAAREALQQQVAIQEQQRQWLEAVLNLLPTPLMLVDPAKGQVTFSNRAANEIAGVDIAKDVGQKYDGAYYCTDASGQLIPQDQLPAVRAAKGEKISGLELTWHTPAGVFPLLVYADTLPPMHNHSVTSVVVFQDIRDRKQIELQLQESQHFINRVANAVPGILYVYDLIEQRNIYVNREVGDVLGYTPNEIQAIGNQLFPRLMHPDDLATLPAHMEKFDRAQDGEIIEREYRMQHATGEWRWLWSRDLIFSRTQDGKPQQVIGISHDITDRKQAEAEALKSEQRFRFLAESIPQIVWVAQANGFTEYYNQRWFNYTGLTLEESQTANGSFRHPDDHERCKEAWIEASTNKGIFQVEQRLRRADGTYRWHLTRAYPWLDENGQVIKWFGSCTDIDDWKRMEQVQRFLSEASQTLAAASLDLNTTLDTVTQLASEFTSDVCILKLLSSDRQWLHLTSCYHVDSNIRSFVWDVFKHHSCSAQSSTEGQVVQTGEPLIIAITSEEMLDTAVCDCWQPYLERFQICSVMILPLRVRGQVIGIITLIRHIPAETHTHNDLNLFQELTDRAAMAIANAQLYQQAEQARQRAERSADRKARLQAITAILSEQLTPAQVAEVIAEQSRVVLNAEAALVAILCDNGTELEIVYAVGYQADLVEQWRRFPLASKTPMTDAILTGEIIWEQSVEERANRYPHIASAYAKYHFTAWMSLPLIVEGRAIGGITLSFTEFSPPDEEDRAFFLALMQQCAQAIARAQLYEAEQQARAEAEAANRMKDEFLAILSHELRTPLNPILGWTTLLRKRNLNSEKTKLALETIERNAKLQVQLIEDLLDISRILQGKLSLHMCLIDLRTIIDAAIETVRLTAETKAIDLQFEVNEDVEAQVMGDAARLQQVIWNLLTNAIKFTPNGGKIEVKLESCEFLVASSQLENLTQPSTDRQNLQGYTQITVTDTGKGIPPEFLPHVFDSFRQADSSITRAFGGLGLGLAIARHLVELHSGSIKAESRGEGQGASFIIQLPLLAIPSKSPEQKTSAFNELSLQGIRVLAVDDEADNLELVTFLLNQAGATVIALDSATDVLNQLNEIQPDVLVADIGMPIMDGYTLLHQIRTLPPEQGGEIPAIALTAYAGELDQKQALAVGFQRHIAKPVDLDLLIEAICQLAQQKRN